MSKGNTGGFFRSIMNSFSKKGKRDAPEASKQKTPAATGLAPEKVMWFGRQAKKWNGWKQTIWSPDTNTGRPRIAGHTRTPIPRLLWDSRQGAAKRTRDGYVPYRRGQ